MFGFEVKKDLGTGFSVLAVREIQRRAKKSLFPRSLLLNRTEAWYAGLTMTIILCLSMLSVHIDQKNYFSKKSPWFLFCDSKNESFVFINC